MPRTLIRSPRQSPCPQVPSAPEEEGVVASAPPRSRHRLPPHSREAGAGAEEGGNQGGEWEGLLTWRGHPVGWSRTALGLV